MLLDIIDLNFSYKSEKKLFENLNFSIEENSIVALVGESGCGKTTLINLIYGLQDWESGSIKFLDKTLLGPKGNIIPGEPNMKLVAQNYDLMPYSTVYDNVGKFISNINLEDKKNKVEQLLRIVEMEEYKDVKPQFLSGGQQQRVAIARALSKTPKLLLLDEPFSNLDFSRKLKVRENIFNYVKENQITLLISTHNIVEIMPWLDRVIILKQGTIVQDADPEFIYNNPISSYVAELFGEVNVLTDHEVQVLQLPKNSWFPHHIKLVENGIPALVIESRFAGNHYWNKIKIHEIELIMYTNVFIQGSISVEFKKN